MLRRAIECFNQAGLHFINVKMQPHRIFESADKTHLRIRLFRFHAFNYIIPTDTEHDSHFRNGICACAGYTLGMNYLRERVATLFQNTFQDQPRFIVRAPGRVNLLGEHVDYNDGFVLPVAIDRAVWIAYSPSASLHSTLVAVDLDERVSFSPETILSKTDLDGKPLPHWAKYPAGCAWALNEAGYETPSINAVFTSDVPRGSGLSSSAALEMAFISAWQAVGGFEADAMTRAKLGQRAENEYVGVNCGIMDQFASACGKRDHALFLDCR